MTVEVSRQDIITDQIIEYKSENRFLKLPPVSYLEMLGISPLPSQMAMINAINNPKYRFLCAALSRRQGKTYIANVIGQLVALIPSSNVLIMSPNYSLSQISFDLQRSLIKHFDLEVTKDNAKDKVISCQLPGDVTTGSRSFSIEATTVIFLNGAQYVLPIEITLGCPSQTSWRQESP